MLREDVTAFLNKRFTPAAILSNMHLFNEINQHLEFPLSFLLEFDAIQRFLRENSESELFEAIRRSETLILQENSKILSLNFTGERLRVLQVSLGSLSEEDREEFQQKVESLKSLVSHQRVGLFALVKAKEASELEDLRAFAAKLGCRTTEAVESAREAYARTAVMARVVPGPRKPPAAVQRPPAPQSRGQYSMTPEEFKRESGYSERVPTIDLRACLGYLYTVEVEAPVEVCGDVFGAPQNVVVQECTRPRLRHGTRRRQERLKTE